MKITKITKVPRNNENVYNLEVNKNHNYYANSCLVSNCHKLATATKISILVKALKPEHMFAFTGSLPENRFDVWSINRIFGSVIYHKKSIELRQDKYISKVRVVALEVYKTINV